MDGVDLHQAVVFGSVVIDPYGIGISVALDPDNVFEQKRGDVVMVPGLVEIGIEIRGFGGQRGNKDETKQAIFNHFVFQKLSQLSLILTGRIAVCERHQKGDKGVFFVAAQFKIPDKIFIDVFGYFGGSPACGIRIARVVKRYDLF